MHVPAGNHSILKHIITLGHKTKYATLPTQLLHQHSTQSVGNPVMPFQNNSFSGTPVKAQSPPQHLVIHCDRLNAPETNKTSWECTLELNSMSNIVEWDRLKESGGGCKAPSLRALNDQSGLNGGFPFGYVKQGRLYVPRVHVYNFTLSAFREDGTWVQTTACSETPTTSIIHTSHYNKIQQHYSKAQQHRKCIEAKSLKALGIKRYI